MLSAMNCSINCKTVDDQTPLHLAAMRLVLLSMVYVLEYKDTRILIYTYSGHAECCKWLVANRASLDAEDKAGRTPIDLAKVCSSCSVNDSKTYSYIIIEFLLKLRNIIMKILDIFWLHVVS